MVAKLTQLDDFVLQGAYQRDSRTDVGESDDKAVLDGGAVRVGARGQRLLDADR